MTTAYAIMSRNTFTRTLISFDALFDGRLERWDVSADGAHRALVDCSGRWVTFDSESGSMVDSFWHSGPRSQDIVDAISLGFNVDVYSEHEPQYWGVDTMEEVEQAMEAFNRRLDEVAAADAIKGLPRADNGEDVQF